MYKRQVENVEPEQQEENGRVRSIQHLSGMFEKWFLDYASYVILERAVPYVNDGLKPVQRRILHAMKEMDDGRFNKVANIVGLSLIHISLGDFENRRSFTSVDNLCYVVNGLIEKDVPSGIYHMADE